MALRPRISMKTTAAHAIRPSTPTPSPALTGLTVGPPTQGKETRTAGQPLVMSEPPRIMSERVTVAPQIRLAF